MSEGQRFLIVRTDRVGDVLLTTPLSMALKDQVPGCHITWCVNAYTAPLLEHNPDVDQVIVADPALGSGGLAGQWKAQHFDAAFLAFPRWNVSFAAWQAGIPRRIGPASKWYSLFFTDRMFQHRSRGEKNEADYNLDLLAAVGLTPKRYPTRLVLTDTERRLARERLEGYRVSFTKPVVILHPGSGGSSERWPLAHFMALGDRLQEAGCDVVVTAGPGETYQNTMADQMRRPPILIAAGSITLRELGAIFSQADVVVSNSTGPLHMAVALDVSTVSIYSPITSCHPRRWGPYPAYAEGSARHAVMIAAEGDTGVQMASVSVDSVLAECLKRRRMTPTSGQTL